MKYHFKGRKYLTHVGIVTLISFAKIAATVSSATCSGSSMDISLKIFFEDAKDLESLSVV